MSWSFITTAEKSVENCCILSITNYFEFLGDWVLHGWLKEAEWFFKVLFQQQQPKCSIMIWKTNSVNPYFRSYTTVLFLLLDKNTYIFVCCVIHREQIYIAPSGVQKERIQVSRSLPRCETPFYCINSIQLSISVFALNHDFIVCVTQPEDMFVCDVEERDISCPPAWKKLKKSQCTPLFMNAYTMRGEMHIYVVHTCTNNFFFFFI